MASSIASTRTPARDWVFCTCLFDGTTDLNSNIKNNNQRISPALEASGSGRRRASRP